MPQSCDNDLENFECYKCQKANHQTTNIQCNSRNSPNVYQAVTFPYGLQQALWSCQSGTIPHPITDAVQLLPSHSHKSLWGLAYFTLLINNTSHTWTHGQQLPHHIELGTSITPPRWSHHHIQLWPSDPDLSDTHNQPSVKKFQHLACNIAITKSRWTRSLTMIRRYCKLCKTSQNSQNTVPQ